METSLNSKTLLLYAVEEKDIAIALSGGSLSSGGQSPPRTPKVFRRLVTARSADTLKVESGVTPKNEDHNLNVKPQAKGRN